jgi:hypothetical protein
MSILDIDFTNYHKVQASRMTLTSRSGLRAKLEQDLQAYLANGGTITTSGTGISGHQERITNAIKLARKMKI